MSWSQKKEISKLTCLVFPRTCPSLSPRISRLDWNAQESKYHKVIPKCSHGKLRITRHNDWYLGYGISLVKTVSFARGRGFDGVQIPPAPPSGKTLHGKRVGIIGTGTPWMALNLCVCFSRLKQWVHCFQHLPCCWNIFEWLIKGRKPMVAVQNQTSRARNSMHLWFLVWLIGIFQEFQWQHFSAHVWPQRLDWIHHCKDHEDAWWKFGTLDIMTQELI